MQSTPATDHRLPRILLYVSLAIALLLGFFIFLALLPVAAGDIPYSFDETPAMEGPVISDPGILPPGLLMLLLLIDCTAVLGLYLFLKVKGDINN